MKLLFAIKGLSASGGGAERILCSISSALSERGHDVSIVTFDPPHQKPFYPLDARIKRVDLAIGDSLNPAGFGETVRRILALRRIVTTERPQVVIGFMHSMYVPLSIAVIGSGIPVVGSEHTVRAHYRGRPLQFFSVVLASPLMVAITVLSERIRETYPGLVAEKMVVMPNAVAAADRPADRSSERQAHVLLNVGRMDAGKDQATLIRAFSVVAQEFPDWRLRIVGAGELRLQLEQLVSRLGLTKRVEMPRVNADIAREYCAADVFVTSSRYEAFGLVTAEAMSHGLPVIGFADCPGTNELILDNESGLLVSAGDDRVLALASGLRTLMQDSALRQRLGARGVELIDQRYSVGRICDRWESLLQRVAVRAQASAHTA
jgi:glycosyltransferase involved in cell wall biosynthesis